MARKPTPLFPYSGISIRYRSRRRLAHLSVRARSLILLLVTAPVLWANSRETTVHHLQAGAFDRTGRGPRRTMLHEAPLERRCTNRQDRVGIEFKYPRRLSPQFGNFSCKNADNLFIYGRRMRYAALWGMAGVPSHFSGAQHVPSSKNSQRSPDEVNRRVQICP